MEDPSSWGRAERVVHEALRQVEQNRREMRMGLSAERLITDALRREGLLVDPPQPRKWMLGGNF